MNCREAIIWLVAAVWFAVSLAGVWAWERYEATPGKTGTASAGTVEVGRWQLTVYAHPHCPCTKATIAELKAIAEAAPDLALRVRIVRPPGSPAGWERGTTWDAASRIAGCDVACDVGGTEASRYGAETSGHALLIDPAGRIAFRGGLTPGRGREGRGRSGILDNIAGRAAKKDSAPVYGCPLFTPDN